MLKVRKYKIPAQPEGKTPEQIMQEFRNAQEQFIEKLATLLYWGNYPLERISRSFSSNEVNSALLQIEDYAQVRLEADGGDKGVTICVRLSQNPLNPKLFEAYDRVQIKRDVEYARERLAELEERYRELFPNETSQEDIK